MAQAFVAGGVAGYLGCRTEPDVLANYVFLTNLLYGIVAIGLADRDAWHRALEVTDHDEIYAYSYFDAAGTEEQYG